MVDILIQLVLFTTKSIILVILGLLLLVGIVAILTRGKEKVHGKIRIKNLNKQFDETKTLLLEEILSKDHFKQFLKEQKTLLKNKMKQNKLNTDKRIFVLTFLGDIKASAVAALREEVTAILSIATPHDEVVVRVESAGGMVHAYGLAAAQLQRIRQQYIPLTVIVDKIAASGGYLMACVANQILAAPFAVIGSIGVVVQLPNFHRLLKEKRIDFEQLTAGNYKRTLSLFGENTERGREKMREEIEEIHQSFKNLIQEYRQQIDIQKVATGEYWLGSQALDLKLVDSLITSDDYLFSQATQSQIYEVHFQIKKSLLERLSTSAANAFVYLTDSSWFSRSS